MNPTLTSLTVDKWKVTELKPCCCDAHVVKVCHKLRHIFTIGPLWRIYRHSAGVTCFTIMPILKKRKVPLRAQLINAKIMLDKKCKFEGNVGFFLRQQKHSAHPSKWPASFFPNCNPQWVQAILLHFKSLTVLGNCKNSNYLRTNVISSLNFLKSAHWFCCSFANFKHKRHCVPYAQMHFCIVWPTSFFSK